MLFLNQYFLNCFNVLLINFNDLKRIWVSVLILFTVHPRAKSVYNIDSDHVSVNDVIVSNTHTRYTHARTRDCMCLYIHKYQITNVVVETHKAVSVADTKYVCHLCGSYSSQVTFRVLWIIKFACTCAFRHCETAHADAIGFRRRKHGRITVL